MHTHTHSDSDPAECIKSFERLLSFTEEGGSVHSAEIAQVIFPVFVYTYLNFVSNGHADVGKSMWKKRG